MKLKNVYSTVKNLKMCEQEMLYVNKIEAMLANYYTELAQDLIGEIVGVYSAKLDEIAKINKVRQVMLGQVATSYYEQVDDQTIVEDLYYLQLCLVAIAGVKCGILKSYDEVAKELKF